MTTKRVNPRLIKLHHSYAIGEVAKRLDVHKNTVRNWQRKGLRPIDGKRPFMFHGATLRQFLEEQRANAKRQLPDGTFYCLKCRTARPPALAMVDYRAINGNSGNLSGLCDTCGTIMHRRIAHAHIAAKMPNIDVQYTGAEGRIT